MSLVFLDDEQRFFKQPAEVWQIIFNFCLDPNSHRSSSWQTLRKVFVAVSKEFNKLIKKVLLEKSPHPYGQLHLASYLCSYGYTSLLQYALANGLRVVTDAISVAVHNGHLDCLKVLADHRCKMCPALVDDAALKGHIHIVEYLIDRRIRPIDQTMKNAVLSGRVDLVKYIQNFVELRAYSDIGRDATTSGSLEMVQYIEQIAPLEQKNIIGSAQKGSCVILQYFIDKGFALNDHLLSLTAITRGHLDFVKLAIDHGAPMSEELMQIATKMNDVEFIKELRARGCPWDGAAIKQAASEGHIKVLKFLIDNDCPFAESTNNSWIRYGFTYSLAFRNEATMMASSGGYIECLKYLMEHGAPWPNDLINKVFFTRTKENMLPMVKYLRERGCPWDATTSADAVTYGSLEVLKYLHENKCQWDKRTCEAAASYGKVDCLKYAIENNCPLDTETMTKAFRSGSVQVLKLLHETGVPWPSDACTTLLTCGTLDALTYAHQNGAQWAADTVSKALQASYRSAMFPRFVYAIESGCPWDPKEALALAKKHYYPEVIEWIQLRAMKD